MEMVCPENENVFQCCIEKIKEMVKRRGLEQNGGDIVLSGAIRYNGGRRKDLRETDDRANTVSQLSRGIAAKSI